MPILNFLTDETKRELQREINRAWYRAGEAAGELVKAAGDDPAPTYSLKGRLVLSKSGWGLLLVPNPLIRGVFNALHEPGVELPTHSTGKLRGHISVLRPEEIEQIGGPEKISEFGKAFSYQLGPLKTVSPSGWPEMNKVWFISAVSPELQAFRRSYGLDPLPTKNGKTLPFHITVGVRKRNVLRNNEVSKAAAETGLTSIQLPPGLDHEEHDTEEPCCSACAEAEEKGEEKPCPCEAEPQKEAADEFAPGIPKKERYGDPSRLTPGKLVTFVRQRHEADRAGTHQDIRIGDEHGLLSFATRKGLPEPGESLRALFQQPEHSHDYADFEGEIPKGTYGAGKVKQLEKGEALVTKSAPGHLDITLASKKMPIRLSLFHPEDFPALNWLAANRTPTEPVKEVKIRHRSIPHTEFDPLKVPEGTVAQPKIDGASTNVLLTKKGPEVFSYRSDVRSGRPITHTERVFSGLPEASYGKDWHNSVLRGELYGVKGDKVLPPQATGALLNATLANSLRKQEREGTDLRIGLFDIQRHGDKPIDFTKTPYTERRKLLEQILPSLPAGKFQLMPQVEGPQAVSDLWNAVRSGKHPLTGEGLVLHPPTGKPEKVKLTTDYDVVVTGTFPGKGRRAETVGGFTYAHPDEPNKTVGRVGSGFSDELLKQIAEDPESFVGRTARLKAQEMLASKALRAPRLLALHEDYPTRSKVAVAQTGLTSIQFDLEKLGLGPVVQKLKDAKAESDRRNYAEKHRIMYKLLVDYPDQFYVDSRDNNIVGLTHRASGFQLHLPISALPSTFMRRGNVISWLNVDNIAI